MKISRTVAAVAAIALSAFANVGRSAVVINEIYTRGGMTSSTYLDDFIELYNPDVGAVSLEGWSLQTTTTSAQVWGHVTPLSGLLAPGAFYLVSFTAGTDAGGAPLPPANATDSTHLFSSTGGAVALVSNTTLISCGFSCANTPGVVDVVAYGTTEHRVGTTPALMDSPTLSNQRVPLGVQTFDNARDFQLGSPTPQASPVPLPAAAWLLLSGLAGIGTVAQRRRRAS